MSQSTLSGQGILVDAEGTLNSRPARLHAIGVVVRPSGGLCILHRPPGLDVERQHLRVELRAQLVLGDKGVRRGVAVEVTLALLPDQPQRSKRLGVSHRRVRLASHHPVDSRVGVAEHRLGKSAHRNPSMFRHEDCDEIATVDRTQSAAAYNRPHLTAW
jgi:hypothetical protein